MKRIHFHSDCPFFAGCENMLSTFFNDPSFLQDYSVSFSYRKNKEYENGYYARIPHPPPSYALHLHDLQDVYFWIDNVFPRFIRTFLKIFATIFLRYTFIALDTLTLYFFLHSKKIDILHINNGGFPGAYSSYSAVFAAKIAKIPVCVYVVNNVAMDYKSPSRWLDFLVDLIMKRLVSVFVTGSNHASYALRNVLSLSKKKVRTIHNGIKVRQVSEDASDVRERLNIPKDRIIIVNVALMVKRKGQIHLLEAMDIVRREQDASLMPVCVIEGDGPERSRLESFVRDHSLSENVIFAGTESEVFNLMNASDIFVLPSVSSEDFPNVVIEAMSLGKPVIGSNFSGIPEQIEDGRTGILVSPGNSRELANAILLLCSDASLRKEMGECGRERFNECFTDQVSIASYRELYMEFLENKHS